MSLQFKPHPQIRWDRFHLSFVVGLLLLSSTACDSNSPDKDIEIPFGMYQQFGVRTVADGDVTSEGLAGVFFQRNLRFNEGDITIEVASDLNSEVGTARGQYETNGKTLRLTIDSSTSSYYERGEVIEYDEVDVVEESFRTSFRIDDAEIEFSGPGLILQKEGADETRKGFFELQSRTD